jgi:hypothetical protein
MGVTEIVPPTPAEPFATGIGGVWAKAKQGIRPSSARDRIATLLMWRSLNNYAPVGSLGMAYFRTTVAKTPSPKCQGAPWTVPRERENQLSRIPCFNSQTRNAARINRFVRAIVPIPGNPGSPDSGSISRRRFRFGRRLGATSEDRRPNVAISAGGFSLQVG